MRRGPLVSLLVLAQLAAAPLAAQDDRARAWREDLDSALAVFLAKDRSFAPAARAAFARDVRALRDAAPRLSDAAIVARLAQATARSGNAHTRLYILRNRTALRRLPVRLWWFRDGLFVVRADSAHAGLLGRRVASVAGVPAERAAERAASLFAGNAAWKRYMSTYALTSPDALFGLGMTTDADAVPLVVEDSLGGRHEVVLRALPLSRTDEPTEAWWDLAPAHPGRGGPWLGALARDAARVPLYLSRSTTHYWHERLADGRTLYVQFNRSRDMEGAPLAVWGDSLLRELEARPPARLVVDLRFNTGGNLDLADALFARIAALPLGRRRGIVALTGPATFSAGIYPAAQLRELAGATVVGEPAGDELDFWAEGGNVVLPNSRLTLHYADRFHSYSPAERPEGRPYHTDLGVRDLGPDVRVAPTMADYLAGRDPVLTAALRLP